MQLIYEDEETIPFDLAVFSKTDSVAVPVYRVQI